MFDAPDDGRIAFGDEAIRVWPMHIPQRQLKLGQQEDVEHERSVVQRQTELVHHASEGADHRKGLGVLILPAAVQAAMHSEIANGLAMRHGLQGVTLDLTIAMLSAASSAADTGSPSALRPTSSHLPWLRRR